MLDLPVSKTTHGARVIAQIEDDDAEFWARSRMIAAAIADADLDDVEDVVRALYAARYSRRDFDDALYAAIAIARERRAQ